MGAPTVLQLTTAAVKREAVSAVVTASSNSSSASFTWTFPPRFGYRRSGGNELIPLVAFTIDGQVRPNNTAISLGNLPTALGLMTALKGLHLRNLGLTRVPSSIAHLTGLQGLYLEFNQITEVPSFIGRLTSLLDLRLFHNRLSSVASSVGKLTSLQELRLSTNQISFLPSSLGRLTGLKTLHLHSNLIHSVQPSFGKLTNLEDLWLSNNTLTTIPPSILTAPRSSSSPNFYLHLEANNISFAAMAAVFAAISTTSSSSSSATANPPSSLVLLGKNPACSSNSSLASRVGPWQIKCEPECALGCRETGIADVKSWLMNGRCERKCDTTTCRRDGGDCQT